MHARVTAETQLIGWYPLLDRDDTYHLNAILASMAFHLRTHATSSLSLTSRRSAVSRCVVPTSRCD